METERMNRSGSEAVSSEELDRTWDNYDAVPRDGPWVFVVDKLALDEGQMVGRWVDALSPPAKVAEHFTGLTGRPVALDDLAVIDQVGLGQRMVDEDWFGTSRVEDESTRDGLTK